MSLEAWQFICILCFGSGSEVTIKLSERSTGGFVQHHGEEGAEPEGKDLNLLHVCSWQVTDRVRS